MGRTPRVAVALGSFALAFALSACGPREAGAPAGAGPPRPPLSARAVYENPDAGLTVAIPRRWEGHYRIETRATSPGGWPAGATHVVGFRYVPLASAVPDQALFELLVFSKPWQGAVGNAAVTTGVVVAEGKDRVVVATRPDSNPFDRDSADAKLYAAMQPSFDELKGAVSVR